MASKDYDLDTFNADGAIGLHPASNGANGYIEALYLYGQITQQIYSIFLSDDGFMGYDTNPSSALIIGEIDLNYSVEEFGIEIPVSQDWTLALNGIIIKDKHHSLESQAVLDTNSKLILGPMNEVSLVFQDFISLYGCGFESHGFIYCECYDMQKFSNITFVIYDQFLSLSPANYFLEVISK